MTTTAVDVTQLYCPKSGGAPGEANTTHHLVSCGALTNPRLVCSYCRRTERELQQAPPRVIWPEGFDPTEVGSSATLTEQEYIAAFCKSGQGHRWVDEGECHWRCEDCDHMTVTLL